jgi:hypothetical protein
MTISEWRRARADRRSVRAEQSSGGWLEYRRHRRASKRAMRAERRAHGRTGAADIQSDKGRAENFSHGFFSDNPPPR